MKFKVNLFSLMLSVLCLLASVFVAVVEHSWHYAALAVLCLLIIAYFAIQLIHDKKKLP